jgi:hypothetical protein
MSVNTQRICDRLWCSKPITVPYQVIEVQYHHPKKLDLCKDCEAEFMLWLGQHALFGHTVQQVAEGRAMGDGTPSQERAQEYLAERQLIAEGPCTREHLVPCRCNHSFDCEARPWGE